MVTKRNRRQPNVTHGDLTLSRTTITVFYTLTVGSKAANFFIDFYSFRETIDCNEPIAVVSHKVGVCRVHKDGKSCRTVFSREYFDGTNSIVKCKLLKHTKVLYM